jgi:GntR family transcriptional regulator, transcriptional repressor for pyruvate dehydrogenase complex
MFKKPVTNRIYQSLVEQIQEAILSGKLKPGDKLPAQRKLQEIFDTSRASIREALRVLEEKGLIEIKLGVSGGAIIKSANIEYVSESLSLLIKQQQIPIRHLMEFREEVEGGAVALAAERATIDDIAKLKGILSEAKKLLEIGIKKLVEFDEVDQKFHIETAKISQNVMFLSIQKMIHNNIHYYFKSLPREDLSMMQQNYEDLVAITNAIEQNHATAARGSAQLHIQRYLKFILAQEKEL